MKDQFYLATQFCSWFLKKHITRSMFFHRGAYMHQKISRRHANFFWTLKLPLCGLVAFKNYINLHVNTYLLTEGGRSFKTFLGKNYIIVLDSCYLFTKKCLTWNWKFTADLMNTLQFIRRWWIWHSVIL